MFRIIVPFCENQDNAEIVATGIHQSLSSITNYEIVFVTDKLYDSPCQDSHIKFIQLKAKPGFEAELIQGFHTSPDDYIIVLGAKAQTHPEFLTAMVQELYDGSEVVIPSRVLPAGNDTNGRANRRSSFGFARIMGKMFLNRVRNISDPMHDTFAMKLSVIENVQFKPFGWNMLIDILSRGNYQSVTEIPYKVPDNETATSRLSFVAQSRLACHILSLTLENFEDRRFFLFAAVGFSGVVINMICYDMMVKFHMNISLAGFLAALTALCSNFMLNDRVTWAEVRGQRLLIRAMKYFITALCGIGFNVGILSFLYYSLHVHYLLANLLGIAVATIWNYTLSNLWAWKSSSKRSVEIIQSSIRIEYKRGEVQ